MSDVEAWLEAHADALSAIAADAEVESRVVHLVAVLVLAGLDDRMIRDQLGGLDRPGEGSPDAAEGAARVLGPIRRLAA